MGKKSTKTSQPTCPVDEIRASRPSRVSLSRPWPSPRGAGPVPDRWSDPLGGVTDAVASASAEPCHEETQKIPMETMGNGELNQPNGGLSSCLPHYNGQTLRKPLFNPHSMCQHKSHDSWACPDCTGFHDRHPAVLLAQHAHLQGPWAHSCYMAV